MTEELKGVVVMNSVFSGADKLGDIVVRFPQAGEIFKQHRIDFCCGGDQPLREATQEHGVDTQALVAELNRSYEEAVRKGEEITDWTTVSMEDLIHHIVNTHHAYLQRVFPPLSELTTKILRVHGKNHGDVLSKVHRLFSQLRMDMEEHMIQEEETVFPRIIAYEHHPSTTELDSIIRQVAELDQDHEKTGDLVKELRRVTKDYALPEDACGTYAYVFEQLQKLEADTFQHIHLENNVLFVELEKVRAQSMARPTAN